MIPLKSKLMYRGIRLVSETKMASLTCTIGSFVRGLQKSHTHDQHKLCDLARKCRRRRISNAFRRLVSLLQGRPSKACQWPRSIRAVYSGPIPIFPSSDKYEPNGGFELIFIGSLSHTHWTAICIVCLKWKLKFLPFVPRILISRCSSYHMNIPHGRKQLVGLWNLITVYPTTN